MFGLAEVHKIEIAQILPGLVVEEHANARIAHGGERKRLNVARGECGAAMQRDEHHRGAIGRQMRRFEPAKAD